MKAIIFAAGLMFAFYSAVGQKQKVSTKKSNPFVPSTEQIKKMASMTEAELDAYREMLLQKATKDLQKLNKQSTYAIADELLPGYEVKIPIKNTSQLNAANLVSTDKKNLLTFVGKLKIALLPLIPASVKQHIDQISSNGTTSQLEANAMSLWYNNRPEVALLFAIDAIEKDPSNILYWNNLGALCNLSKLYAQAIPILKFSLLQAPGSTMVMNNLGQAYLSLGDLYLAQQYLKKCLDKDPLNPEANRSMAMINISKGQKEQAVSHFSAELQVAFRQSSMAIIRNSGLEEHINFAEIFKKGNARLFHLDETIEEEPIPEYENLNPQPVGNGPNNEAFQTDSYNFNYSKYIQPPKSKASFNGLHLNRFELPPFPKSLESAAVLVSKHREFQRNSWAEFDFWFKRVPNAKEQQMAQHQTMMYGDWALLTMNGLQLEELHKLTFADQEWQKNIADWSTAHTLSVSAIKAKPHNSQAELCAELKVVHNKYIELVSTYLEGRHHILQARWKIYIDRMGQIASISPNLAGGLYASVQGYFAYLNNISTQVNMLANLDQCNPSERQIEPYDLFSNRLFEIMCDKGIGTQLPFGMVKVHLNCEGLTFSGTVELLKFGMEKKFKTGTTTIWIGGGVEANFKDVFEVEATQKLFVVWDKNNVCTDAGLSGTGKLSISNIESSEFGYSFGVNSGFNAEFKTANDFSSKVDKVMGFL